ncbi:2-dehydro-3-deoxygalactonokinase [Roseobacter sp. N2S]|uniref:2-dehydro-3-deoxygalactonokinase n=1 Tax=Roseobacter sp. N2S TaxID=2663844 RepID=UPI002862A6DD|nr:2-dehydro-3-deoxygalactonokinase [Roseobacter sp. N2S]MDR6263892.1 2-dehydro-3-deoxygalactonokinase [Roseobacter sp. N2S]
MRDKTAWIAVDWGTSNLRIWAMGADNTLLAERSSDQGMGGLDPSGFEPVLLAIIDEFLADSRVTPVICCGMVGARQGWVEADYLATPCTPPNGAGATRVTAQDPRIDVMILPGVKQLSPPDVMRGEETQIAGFLRDQPKFDGVLVMPGTHTKWVHISAEEVVSFQTFMTGEIYALLARQSVLRHSVAVTGWDDAAFEDGLSAAISRPESVAAKLFGLRAASLLSEASSESARAQLSGLLIGLELAATRPYWLGQNLAIIATPEIGAVYAKALALQGLQAKVYDAQPMTRSGLIAAYDSLLGAGE